MKNRNSKKRGLHMINANELISVAESLPLELKTELIERLLSSLNPSHNSNGRWLFE
ncbi:MAG: hypothetical protein GY795_39400 [Desulfobacterales bacterium]|nr:hypothetical protein [Desulfobacterales bacterium]